MPILELLLVREVLGEASPAWAALVLGLEPRGPEVVEVTLFLSTAPRGALLPDEDVALGA